MMFRNSRLDKYWTLILNAFRASLVGRPAMEKAALVNYLAVLEDRGIRAHIYMPSVGILDDTELCEALERLSLAGYVFTNSQGELLGRSSLQLNSNERASRPRSNFKVVDKNSE